jgi:hypothetical protein
MHSPDENSAFKQIILSEKVKKITFIQLAKQKENYFKVQDFLKSQKLFLISYF